MNTKLITLGLALCLSFVANAQKGEVRSAMKALDQNNFADAKTELEKAKELNIEAESEKWVNRYYNAYGKFYFGPNEGKDASLEDLKKAAEFYNKTLANDANDEDALNGITQIKNALVNGAVDNQNEEKFELASKKLYTSYQLGKKDTVHLYYAAGNAINAQKYDTAIDYFKTLMELGFDGSSVTYFATNTETGQKESFGQDKDYRDIALKTGDYKDPVDEKSPSLKAEIAKTVSRLYLQLEEPEKAMQAVQVAKEMDPEDITMLQVEADLYYQMDNLEMYREIMNKVKDMAPDDANVYLNLGISSEQLDDMEAAKQFYEKAIELNPELLNAYLNLASVILAKEQGIIDQMNELGMSAADNKKYEKLNQQKQEIYVEALPILLEAYKINPDSKGVVQTLMNIYYQTGEDEKAKDMKEKLDAMN